jgi:hypothetical protein
VLRLWRFWKSGTVDVGEPKTSEVENMIVPMYLDNWDVKVHDKGV